MTRKSTPTPSRSSSRKTVAAGNAKINAVSGATYTSNGYIASLQSALDKAGI